MNDQKSLKEISLVARELQPESIRETGKALAAHLNGNVPVVYASSRNAAAAKNWKIILNETGKIPAFWNVLPELNHNEMTGFDVKRSTRELSDRFHFVFLDDAEDDVRVAKRMRVLQGLYRDRGLKVEIVKMSGGFRVIKIFASVNLAQWTAYYTAINYGIDPENVPMIEEFKTMIG